MPTYEVVCVECGRPRWPTLPDRPTQYVCARCVSLPSGKGVQRREVRRRIARTRKPRQTTSQDSPAPPEG
jgi:hypothetical protein